MKLILNVVMFLGSWEWVRNILDWMGTTLGAWEHFGNFELMEIGAWEQVPLEFPPRGT
jgi:hypothetical protein